MRWDRLFDDLQAQLDADGQRELDLEVSDRTRRERAQVGLHERFIAHRGCAIELRLAAGVQVSGRIADAGANRSSMAQPRWAMNRSCTPT